MSNRIKREYKKAGRRLEKAKKKLAKVTKKFQEAQKKFKEAEAAYVKGTIKKKRDKAGEKSRSKTKTSKHNATPKQLDVLVNLSPKIEPKQP